MNDPQRIISLATLLGVAGVWLMLPRGAARGRMAGAVLTAAALGLGASQLRPLGDWTADGLFYLLAGVTTVAALATVTFRNPVVLRHLVRHDADRHGRTVPLHRGANSSPWPRWWSTPGRSW